MKKALVLLTLTFTLLMCLAACNGQADHVHNFGEWEITKNPSCTEAGERARYCSCGDKQTEAITATGHNFSDWTVTKEATCTEAGEKTRYCSCGDKQTEAITATGHNFSDWTVTKEATCTEAGEKTRSCSCGETEIFEIARLPHQDVITPGVPATCTQSGLTEGSHCSVCNEVLIAQTVVAAIGHSYESVVTPPTKIKQGYTTYTCSACGDSYIADYVAAIVSVGLSYEIDGNNCIITGIGSCTDTEIVIPAEIEGVAVTTIGDSAFMARSELTSIVIPDSITSIGVYAFEDCSSLTNVYISDVEAWLNISFGNTFSYPNYYGNLHILDENGNEITELVIPDGVTSIGDYAFCYCSSLTSIVIPDGVIRIGDYAFYGCSSLTGIVIPDSVTSIVSGAFYDCGSLSDVYYTGTGTEWASISIDSYNSDLTGATIHYNYVPEE